MSVSEEPLAGRVSVVSPHLDDGVFSLGAAIWEAVRRGAVVSIVTVLAGDPVSELPAAEWDRACGFRTAGEAIRARRAEDEAACATLGAAARWLPFADAQYPRGAADDVIGAELASLLADAEMILLPGFPLTHPDHAFVASLALASLPEGARVALYSEQPYAADDGSGPSVPAALGTLTRDPAWATLPGGPDARAAKRRAALTYRSQVRLLGGRRTLRRVARYEAARGGETIGWLNGRR